MIFNPLYFSESGNSRMLVDNSSKLSKKQYLFSDIVKVIMKSDREQKKIMETGLDKILKNQTPSMAGIENESQQLKIKELSEKDHDKVKSDLADILPPDIAQLLMNNNVVLKNGEALSYISEEPLEGDLENFIKGLVGEDVLNKNITNNTGLFLHLEDAKSAVNIELKKVSDSKVSQGKVIVQTLVVPEKSKLISIFNTNSGEGNLSELSKETLSFNLPLNKMDIESIIQDQNADKPTLSVYSFKNPETQTTSVIENKNNIKLDFANPNLVVSSKSNFNSKIPLNKISFIPNELKEGNQKIAGTINYSKSPGINEIEAVGKNPKDFSVTKITIVKKQGNISNDLIKKLQVENKKVDTSLRQINFKEGLNSNKNELSLIKNLSNDQNKIENIKNVTKNLKQQIGKQNYNPNEIKNGKTIAEEGSIKNLSKLSNIKYYTNANDDIKSKSASDEPKQESNNISNNEKVSKLSIQNELKTVKSDKSNLNQFQIKSTVTDYSNNKIHSTTSNSKTEQNTNVESNSSGQTNDINNSKNSVVSPDSKKVTSKIESFLKKSEEKESSSTKAIEKKEVAKNINVKPDQNNSGKIIEKMGLKHTDHQKNETIPKSNENSSQKAETNHVHKDNVQKQNVLDPKNDKNVVAVNENSDNDQNENKKITVKVRNEIKSITNKVDGGNKNIAEQSNSNSANNPNGESEKNLKNSSNPILNITEKNKQKNDHEINFGHSLKDEISKDVDTLKKTFTENQPGNTQKYVKSSEVMKEITKFITKQEKGTLSFDIKPEHLGKMKITLDTTEHAVKATIQVDNEHAKTLVERNIQKLHQELNNNGVQLSSINISLGQPKNHRSERHSFNKTGNNNSNFSQEDNEVNEENSNQKSLGYNTYEYIA